MIEIMIMDFLKKQNIEGIGENIFLEVPQKVPEQYILIQKTGGNIVNHIKHATLAIRSISSKSKYSAAVVNAAIIDNLLYKLDNAGIASCTLNSTYDFPDVTTKKHRYQSVFNFNYY